MFFYDASGLGWIWVLRFFGLVFWVAYLGCEARGLFGFRGGNSSSHRYFAVCTSDLETMEFDMSILHGPGVWVWFIRFLFLYTVFGYKI
jgi:hypothetical protein